jgi:hypothetical protein
MAIERGYQPDTDYMWTYGTFIDGVPGFEKADKDEEKYSAGIDSRRLGNYLVFIILLTSEIYQS